jgi:hypothetical protein
MSHFQQKLDTQLTSAFDLLIQLNELTGLVYLYDNHTPTIGFLPQEFLVLEQSELKNFIKLNLINIRMNKQPYLLAIFKFSIQFTKFNENYF